jgi:hypothetical protein
VVRPYGLRHTARLRLMPVRRARQKHQYDKDIRESRDDASARPHQFTLLMHSIFQS